MSNDQQSQGLLDQVLERTEESVVTGALAEITRAEVDMQIATAKRYPRSLRRFKQLAMEMATLDEETAASCFYALPRSGKTIEGPSARFAEIIAVAWTNLRCGARIISAGQNLLTSQGFAHDLESNVGVTIETQRRITNSKGQRFNDDMIVVTGNAAASIAYRNAVLKVVPQAYWKSVFQAAKQTAIGNAVTLSARRQSAIEFLAKMSVSEKQILDVLGRNGVEEITLDDLGKLRGFITAIKDGDTTIEEAFSPPKPEKASSLPTGRANMKEPATPPPAAVESPNSQEEPPLADVTDFEKVVTDLYQAVNTVNSAQEMEALQAKIKSLEGKISPDAIEDLTQKIEARLAFRGQSKKAK
jgi:hypothetical protein